MRLDKRVPWKRFLLALPLLTIFFGYYAQPFGDIDNISQAADAREFNAGNIMSDFVMTNKNSMTKDQIQSFLKSKNHCNNRDIHMAGWYPNVSYNIKDGKFVCMADEDFDGETAAKIIWQAGQDYGINPQVLIVLLQKEQGLVTDTWPNNVQYRTATGYGCPDTAPCEAEYFGFRNQVRNAARFFRAYQDNAPGWYKPYWTGDNIIKWHPNSDCGTSLVNIENRATASLYSYTPYRPNQAALNAQYGIGDSCSSYGNRNFWLYFTDWFGTTQVDITIPQSDAYILNGTYTIQSQLDTNFVLDIEGDNKQNKANVQLFTKKDTNNDNQKFEIKRTDDNYYTLRSVLSGKYLDVEGVSVFNKANVQLYDWNGGCNQRWAIVKSGGYYSILSSCSGRALDIAGGNAVNKANVQIFETKQPGDNGNQLWLFN